MSTNVESNSGKSKVSISVDCPCKLSVQGREFDALPGSVFSFEPVVTSLPSVFFIEFKELSSVLTRVIALRRDLAGRLNAVRKMSRPGGFTYERGYLSCRESSLVEFIQLLDEIILDYSL